MARMLSGFLNENLFIGALKVSLQNCYLEGSKRKLLWHVVYCNLNFSIFTVVFGDIFLLKRWTRWSMEAFSNGSCPTSWHVSTELFCMIDFNKIGQPCVYSNATGKQFCLVYETSLGWAFLYSSPLYSHVQKRARTY